MCYHSKQTQKATKLENRFKAKVINPQQTALVTSNHWNGFDFPLTPVITNTDPKHIQLYHWGLIPSWADDESIRQVTLNAKIETLDEKASFKDHNSHRCLVLANGFYEWQWIDPKGKKKQKYDVGIKDDEPFAYAGIWSEWVDASTGEISKTYSIVTTEAQRIMRDIHNSKLRMPVVLRPDQEKSWLSGDNKDNYIDTEVELIGTTENLQLGLFG